MSKMSAARRQLVASGDGDLAKNKVLLGGKLVLASLLTSLIFSQALVEFIRECAECVTALKSAAK